MSDDDFWTGADIMHKISQNKQEYQKGKEHDFIKNQEWEWIWGEKKVELP